MDMEMTSTTQSLSNSRNGTRVALSCFCIYLWCVFVFSCGVFLLLVVIF